MLESTPLIADDRRIDRTVAQAGAASGRTVVELSIHDDLATVESAWRKFETTADATAFQAFDWLSAWCRHIGILQQVTPAVVLGRHGTTGELLFLLPLAVSPGAVRRLEFLGSDLGDYNAPLLAPGFSDWITPDHFRDLWREIGRRMQASARHRHDLVQLTKLPENVGEQRNPLLALETGLNPSGAHIATLPASWDAFYRERRSSATRRRDRSKRKRLAEMGEVQFVTPRSRGEMEQTIDCLLRQKAKSFARMGVADVFSRPGFREFFLDLAVGPRAHDMVHVSRLDVGTVAAAVNYGLVFRGTYYHVVASYDDGEVARFGPGAAHLRELLRYAIERQCGWFDFTIGDEPYKREWSDRTLDLYDHVSAATVRGRPFVALIAARRRLKRVIKQNQKLWTAFSRLRSAFGRKRAVAGVDDDGVQLRKSPSIAPD